MNKNFEDFTFSEDKEKVKNNFTTILKGGRYFERVTARIIKKDKGIRWVEINSHLMKKSGKIKGITGSITDIHERKLAEEELIKAKEKAEESDRLKSIFLAQVSHEIRTPLNIIISYNSLLQEEMNKIQDGLMASEFQAIENGSRRLLRTIDLILNMSMLQSGSYDINLEKLDLDYLLTKLIYEFKSLLKEKSLELVYKNEINDSRIIADEYTLTEAFQNLIHNAVKYTNAGKVEIRIYNKNDKKVFVDVSDTGIGISEEYFPKLFTPFSQEDHGYSRKFEGNGLGLALTKKYIELNNAEINVISKKGKGTTFTVSLISFAGNE
jgi:signal transduction histidine kinase